MSSPARDIVTLLETAAVGVFGTDLHVGKQPETPDADVCVFDIGGTPPNPVWLRDSPQFSVLIRGAAGDYAGGWDKATEVKNALLGLSNQTIGDAIYALFNMKTDTTFISYDSSNRPLFSQNWVCNIDWNVAAGSRKVIA